MIPHLPTRISCEMLAGIFVSPVAHVDTHIFVSLFFSGKNALFTETCRSCRDRRWVDFKLYLWYVCANSTYWLWWFYAVPRVLLKILRFRNLSWGPKKKSNPCDPRTFPPGDLVIGDLESEFLPTFFLSIFPWLAMDCSVAFLFPGFDRYPP